MSMEIPFWKMHGAANDFILVDDRAETFPAADRGWIAGIAARRTGVGSDGVILVQPSDTADFRMRFFNPDGGEVEMCGNGARCVARLAHDLGAAPATMRIDTVAGLLRAEARGTEVLLHMTDPAGLQLDDRIEVEGMARPCHIINTGVPHVVLPVDDLADTDVQRIGAAVRYHPRFAPAGTNANFVQVTGPGSLAVRTYERGVEAETLACGTGIVACAVTMSLAGATRRPVQVTARSGDVLTVDFQETNGRASAVTLLGPALYVCRGTLSYPAPA